MKIVLLIPLGLFLASCTKIQTIKEVEVITKEIPEYFFDCPKVVSREIETSEDIEILLIDLYDGYSRCENSVEAIIKINKINKTNKDQ